MRLSLLPLLAMVALPLVLATPTPSGRRPRSLSAHSHSSSVSSPKFHVPARRSSVHSHTSPAPSPPAPSFTSSLADRNTPSCFSFFKEELTIDILRPKLVRTIVDFFGADQEYARQRHTKNEQGALTKFVAAMDHVARVWHRFLCMWFVTDKPGKPGTATDYYETTRDDYFLARGDLLDIAERRAKPPRGSSFASKLMSKETGAAFELWLEDIRIALHYHVDLAHLKIKAHTQEDGKELGSYAGEDRRKLIDKALDRLDFSTADWLQMKAESSR